jgi:secreted PhoX family phosphatase
MANIDDDGISNFSKNETFQDVVEARLSRRNFLGNSVGLAAAASGVATLMQSMPAQAAPKLGKKDLLGFTSIPVSTADTVVVPPGYSWEVLIAWGDPVSDGPEFKQDASNTSDEQAQQWGMHNDGLVYFPIQGSKRGLLVQNNEYTDDELLFPDGTMNWDAEKTKKSIAAHGVSVIEIERKPGKRGDKNASPYGKWEVVRPSRYARRITGHTPIKIGGPAAGDDRLKTSADPTGTSVLGTVNNCAMGFTPWGTYLTCEENFNGYFRKTGDRTQMEMRYGITEGGFGYLWHLTDSRFDVNAEPNEPNRFGWVVEIDPSDPTSTPVKRTALGRCKHEGAWVQEARDGRVVVYSGDDERFEYIYRYVSNLPWRQARAKGINPLDDGILYVAQFTADGKGKWLPLTPSNLALAGWTINDILINTRTAADLAGATKMDRPEWIDTFPETLTAIATLTNNSNRGIGVNPGVDASNPRPDNDYGHIIRWYYKNDWTEPTFGWDIFALCGDPTNADPTRRGNVVGDKYGSPDGIYVAPSSRLWIQTDVSSGSTNVGDYAGFGNNQMLCADPYTKETRRFLVGPNRCEITGAFVTPDEKSMFVGIQHPGEAPSGALDPANPKSESSWPGGPASGRPRSACIVITKDDGGEIGS